MAAAGAIDSAVPAPRLPIRHVAAVVAGNGLEFYDFLTYAFFAVQIGHTFFPSQNPTFSLLSSLATFGAGFITRPLGGYVIGFFGDRVGRKPAMLLSFSLMGIAITGLALTPSYSAIGIAAPVIAIGFRLLQGFALGGEVGPSTAYLVEAAPAAERGLYASMQYATQNFAVLCAGVIGVVLANYLDARALDEWGWRVAFLIGAAIVPFGLVMRRTLAETLHNDAGAADAPHTGFGPYLVIAALGILMLASGTIANYVLDYMTTYASATLHMKAQLAFGATVVNGLCGIVFSPLGGMLSDKIGRKPMMIVPWVLLLIVTFPAFAAIAHYRNATALFAATAVLSAFIYVGTPAVLVALTESLPRRIRSGALSTIYALAISTFGGTTQFIVTWLIARFDNPLVPAWYMIAGVVAGIAGMLLMRETAPVRTRDFRPV